MSFQVRIFTKEEKEAYWAKQIDESEDLNVAMEEGKR